MVTKRSYSVVSAALVLCVSACSSGGANHAAVTSTTAVVVNLGSCPTKYPTESVALLNAGIDGLGRNEVPVRASGVRVCQYGAGGGLANRSVLLGAAATRIVNESNALLFVRREAVHAGTTAECGPGPLFLTFAGGAQNVSVSVDGCDVVSNGVFVAIASTKWLEDVKRWRVSSTFEAELPLGPTGPPG